MGHFEAKFREEGLDRFSSDLKETWGCRMQKKLCRYLVPFEHNAQTCQTDNQADHGTVFQ